MLTCPQSLRPLAWPWPQRVASIPRPRQHPPLWLLGLLCLSVPCVGFDPHKPRHSECERNLKALYTTARALQQDRSSSAPALAEQLGLLVERGNRYAYFLGEGPLEQRSGQDRQPVPGAMGVSVDSFKFPGARPFTLRDVPAAVAAEVGIHGTCPDCEFVAACAGDIDNNPLDTPDVWSLSSQDRVIDGEPIPAGQPYHHLWDAED